MAEPISIRHMHWCHSLYIHSTWPKCIISRFAQVYKVYHWKRGSKERTKNWKVTAYSQIGEESLVYVLWESHDECEPGRMCFVFAWMLHHFKFLLACFFVLLIPSFTDILYMHVRNERERTWTKSERIKEEWSGFSRKSSFSVIVGVCRGYDRSVMEHTVLHTLYNIVPH